MSSRTTRRNRNRPPQLPVTYNINYFEGERPKKKKWWQKGWILLSGIVVILTGLSLIRPVRELFYNTHDIYEHDNFDAGTLNPIDIKNIDLAYDTLEMQNRPLFNRLITDTFPVVKGVKIKPSDKHAPVFIQVGSGMWVLYKSELQKGIRIFNPVTTDECSQTQLSIILYKDRIYASAEFRDLKTGQIVGIMDYNHWKVYLKNLLDYRYSDDKLEVLDKQGYVIFSILFSDKGQASNGGLSISGYFMNPNSVLIVNTDSIPTIYTDATTKEARSRRICITKDSNGKWQLEAEKMISKIQSVYDR
jgi:hypothetical protein